MQFIRPALWQFKCHRQADYMQAQGREGVSGQAPELSVVGWEGWYPSSDMDDDIPF